MMTSVLFRYRKRFLILDWVPGKRVEHDSILKKMVVELSLVKTNAELRLFGQENFILIKEKSRER